MPFLEKSNLGKAFSLFYEITFLLGKVYKTPPRTAVNRYNLKTNFPLKPIKEFIIFK